MQVRHLPTRDRRCRSVTTLKCTSARVPLFLTGSDLPISNRQLPSRPPRVAQAVCTAHRRAATRDGFSRTSLSSLRTRISRRSRSFSRASSRSSAETTSVSRCAFTHLFRVDKPTPRSSATRRRESPLVNAIRTASLRNSSFLPVPMVHLLCCTLRDQRCGTKPRQVHTVLPSSPKQNWRNLAATELLDYRLRIGLRAHMRAPFLNFTCFRTIDDPL